jgi:glycosyltransferase involved in cell wall biosynthesis
VLRTYSETFESEVEKIIHEFDVVFVDHYEVAQYVPRDYTGQVIYHAHNAYHKIWESYSTTGANPFTRVVSHWESQRVLQAELDVCRRAQLTFASPNDIEALVACGADPVRMEETFHLGDESQLEQPPMVFEETTERLVFVGHLAWEPNVTGLLWFLSEVWPRLLLQHPCLHLDIVGANPDRRLQRAAERDRRVHLLGYVEDLEDVYPRSRVNIAPLQFGAGMKVKVLNAMARGIPVVTTPVGAEGIEVENGQHLLISDDAEQMAQDILQLLVDPPLWQRLSNKSRELVTERYTWDKLYTRMLLAMDPARRLRLIRSRMTAGVRNLRERRLGAA